jgi:ABC-2 type transport system permease protein
MIGFQTLLKKEILRFWSVLGQTVTAPVITALLYLMVFAQALKGRVSAYEGIDYTQFLLPGLVMMTVLQNAFANSSSSLIQSKVMGNIVFMMMAPLSALDIFAAYLLASIVRAALVASAMLLAALCFVSLPLEHPVYLLLIFLLAAGSLSALGLVAGIVAQKFDHIAAFTNFFITPMSFLAGVFYSVKSLPSFWYHASHLNPFFYFVDGFRYGFFGQSDVPIGISLAWGVGFFLLASSVAYGMLARGYKLLK